MLVASEVYKTNNWNDLKKYYVYEPDDLLKRIKKKKTKSPLLVWDDAGNWLHSQDYQKKRVVETCKYFQVARPHWGCIMLTTVDAEDIVSRIRNMNNRILIQVMKNSSKREPDRRAARYAAGHSNKNIITGLCHAARITAAAKASFKFMRCKNELRRI